MEFLQGALVTWIVISWMFFLFTKLGCIDADLDDKAVWFLFAPMLIFVVVMLPIGMFHTLSPEQFEELKKGNFIYKKIGRNWWLCRYAGDRRTHPFTYHLMLPMYIKIK